MPPPTTPATPGPFSLADLGRYVRSQGPDLFAADDDDLSIGQSAVNVHPELGKLVDPTLTAGSLLGLPPNRVPGGQVQLPSPGVAAADQPIVTRQRLQTPTLPAAGSQLPRTQRTRPVAPPTGMTRALDAVTAPLDQGLLAAGAKAIAPTVGLQSQADWAAGRLPDIVTQTMAHLSGFTQGVTEQVGEIASSLTSPLNLAITAATAGGNFFAGRATAILDAIPQLERLIPEMLRAGNAAGAARTGEVLARARQAAAHFKTAAQVARGTQVAAGIPVMVQGAEQAVNGDGVIEKALGVTQAAAGGAILGAGVSALRGIPTSLGEAAAAAEAAGEARFGGARDITPRPGPSSRGLGVDDPPIRPRANVTPETEVAGHAAARTAERVDAGTAPAMATTITRPVEPPVFGSGPEAPPVQGGLPGTSEPGMFGAAGTLGDQPVSGVANIAALEAASAQGRLIKGWSPTGDPILGPDAEAAPAAAAATASAPYTRPERNLTLEHLTGQEVGTLRRIRTELAGWNEAVQASPELFQRGGALAEDAPRFLQQLTGVEPGGIPTHAPHELTAAIDDLLEENLPSPLTDRMLETVREWHQGLDVPTMGTDLVEPSWAEETLQHQRGLALERPGETFSREDHARSLQQRLEERQARLVRPERATVTVEVPTGRTGRPVRRKVELIGRALERYRAEDAAVNADPQLKGAEKRQRLRQAAGVLTEAERTAEAAAAKLPPAERQRRLKQQLFDRGEALAQFGEPRLSQALQTSEQRVMEREMLRDPETNPHLGILQTVEDRGGVMLAPKGTRGKLGNLAYGGAEAEWLAEFGRGGGHVAGRRVFKRLTPKEFADRKTSGRVQTLQQIAHEVTGVPGPYEGMSASEFETAFEEALHWARDHWAEVSGQRQRAPRRRGRGAQPALLTEVDQATGVEPPPETPPPPDSLVESMRVGPRREASLPGEGRLRMGGVSARGGRVMAKALYTGAPTEIVPRELVQNALDETAAAHPDGSGTVTVTVHTGEYGVDSKTLPFDPANRESYSSVEVADTGRGIPLAQLETVFTDLFESGKATEAAASGGFGVAKAAILQGGAYAEIETVVDETSPAGRVIRMRHRWEGDPEGILSEAGTRDVSERVPAGTPTGSRVRVWFPEEGWTLTRGVKQLINRQAIWGVDPGATLVGRFTEYRPGDVAGAPAYGKANESEGITVARQAAPTHLTPLGELETPYGKVTFYEPAEALDWLGARKPAQRGMRTGVSAAVLNNHRFALTGPHASLGWNTELPNLPETVVADVTPGDIAEADEFYPFTLARDAIKPGLNSAIEGWIKTHILEPAQREYRDQIGTAFDRVPHVRAGNRLIDVYNVGERYTPEELRALLASPTMARLAPRVADVLERMAATLYPDKSPQLVKTGLLLSKNDFGGVNIKPASEGDPRFGAFINPFTPIMMLLDAELPLTVEQYARGLAHLAIHEITHLQARGGDNAAFTWELARNHVRYGKDLDRDIAAFERAVQGVTRGHVTTAAPVSGVSSRVSAPPAGQASLFGDTEPATVGDALNDAISRSGEPGLPAAGDLPADLLESYGLHARILDREGTHDPLVDERNRAAGPEAQPAGAGGARADDGGGGAVERAAGVGELSGRSEETAPATAPASTDPWSDEAAADRDAPFGSPARAKYHAEQVSVALRSYFTSAGMFNLERAPRALGEITKYGANRVANGFRNFTKWAAEMRRAYPWLVREQTEAIWRELKAAENNAATATKALLRPTSPEEARMIAGKQQGRAPTSGLAEFDSFQSHLADILDLTDWNRILRIEGNQDPAYRINKQIAQQILARSLFDPIAAEMGLMDRRQLAEYFTAVMSMSGRTLGVLGNAVAGNWEALSHMEAARAIGARRLGDSPLPGTTAGRIITLADGTEAVKVGEQVYRQKDLERYADVFEGILDDLALSQAEGGEGPDALDTPGWITRLAHKLSGETGSTTSANAGALLQALQAAAVDELHWAEQDPTIKALAGTHGPMTAYTIGGMLRKERGSLLADANNIGIAAMLSQLPTAIRNLAVQNVVLPFSAVTHLLAGGLAAGAHGIGARRATPNVDRQRVRQQAVEKHLAYAKHLGLALTESADIMRGLTPFLGGRPWADTIDEIFKLDQSLAASGLTGHDPLASLYLLRDIPSAATDFLGQMSLMEDADTRAAHRFAQKLARGLTTLNRWQEFTTRTAVYNATLHAEFQRRGLDYGRFVDEVKAAQRQAMVRAAGGGPVVVKPRSTLQPGVIQKYFPNPQDYVDLVSTAVHRALDVTFAGKGLPNGLEEAWMGLFNAKYVGGWFRLIRPFPRFIMRAAMFLYDHNLSALLELPIYAGTGALSHVSQRLQGIPQLGPAGRARGRFARAYQNEVAEHIAVPKARLEVDLARQRLELAVQQLRGMTLTYRREEAAAAKVAAANLRAQVKAQQQHAAATAAYAAQPGLTGVQPPPVYAPPPQVTSPPPTVTPQDLQDAADRKADLAIQLRKLRQAEAQLSRVRRRLEQGGAGDRYTYWAKALGGTAFLLGTALAVRAMMANRDELPWHQWELPRGAVPETPEGKAAGATPSLDIRSYNPLAQYGLFADLMLDWRDHIDLDVLHASVEALEREHPDRPRWANWTEAVRDTYKGKYTQAALRRELVDALFTISKTGVTQSVLTDIITGQDPEAMGDAEKMADAAIAVAGSIASRYTVPLRQVVQLVAGVSEAERTQRWSERTRQEGVPMSQGPLGQPLENIPGVRQTIPPRTDPFTGTPRMIAHPWSGLLGVTIAETGAVQRRFEALGITPQQWGVKQTQIPEIDQVLNRHYAELLNEVVRGIITDPEFTRLSIDEQRRTIIGVQGKGEQGQAITVAGMLPDLKAAAVGRTLAESDAILARFMKARPTVSQRVDYERFMRAMTGEVQWLKEAHGVDLLGTPEEEAAPGGDGSGGAAGVSLGGGVSPPPTFSQ